MQICNQFGELANWRRPRATLSSSHSSQPVPVAGQWPLAPARRRPANKQAQQSSLSQTGANAGQPPLIRPNARPADEARELMAPPSPPQMRATLMIGPSSLSRRLGGVSNSSSSSSLRRQGRWAMGEGADRRPVISLGQFFAHRFQSKLGRRPSGQPGSPAPLDCSWARLFGPYSRVRLAPINQPGSRG